MYEQTLYKVITDHVKPNVVKQKNRYNKWEYGYNKEYDMVIISRSGKIGDIYEIQDLGMDPMYYIVKMYSERIDVIRDKKIDLILKK